MVYQSPEGATPDFQASPCIFSVYSSSYQSPEGATPDFQVFRIVRIIDRTKEYQSPEGATPDFQEPYAIATVESSDVSIPRRGHARFPAVG